MSHADDHYKQAADALAQSFSAYGATAIDDNISVALKVMKAGIAGHPTPQAHYNSNVASSDISQVPDFFEAAVKVEALRGLSEDDVTAVALRVLKQALDKIVMPDGSKASDAFDFSNTPPNAEKTTDENLKLRPTISFDMSLDPATLESRDTLYMVTQLPLGLGHKNVVDAIAGKEVVLKAEPAVQSAVEAVPEVSQTEMPIPFVASPIAGTSPVPIEQAPVAANTFQEPVSQAAADTYQGTLAVTPQVAAPNASAPLTTTAAAKAGNPPSQSAVQRLKAQNATQEAAARSA